MWAICSDPDKRDKKWAHDAFFASGKTEVAAVLRCVAQVGVTIDWNSPALDFGCGIGRLTQALAAYFAECWGMDISPTMLRLAQEFGRDIPQCRFVLNESEQLGGLQENYFGFIYTSIVLQHIAKPYSLNYIAELMRVLKPGGVLIFQVPDKLRLSPIKKLRARLAMRSRLQSFLRPQETMLPWKCIAFPKLKFAGWWTRAEGESWMCGLPIPRSLILRQSAIS